MRTPPKRRILFGLALAIGMLAAPAPAPAVRPPGETTTVYLVRHAEKSDGADPELTAVGKDRAVALAEILGDEGIGRVLSSDTRRTRDTAAPLAERLGLEVELYDPHDLEELVSRLQRHRGAAVLVVGHSDTTPAVVEALGGEAGSPIEEDEYDRLYRLELPSGRTTLERFEVVALPVE